MLKQRGFTLVELVVVLVVVAALGVGITNFIGRSVQGVSDTAERQKLAQIAWIVSEKLSRSLRDALPNSVRLNASGSCIEFIPTLAGSDYLSVPVAASAVGFEAIPFSNYGAAQLNTSLDRVAVFPSAIAGLYNLSARAVISPTISAINSGSTPGALQLVLSGAHQFLADSPVRRLYIVQNPQMYCFEGSRLNLYRDYGYRSAMPTTSGLASSVIATDIVQGRFEYNAGTLARTGLINVLFEVSEGGSAAQAVNQEVQLRNVP